MFRRSRNAANNVLSYIVYSGCGEARGFSLIAYRRTCCLGGNRQEGKRESKMQLACFRG